MAKTPPLFVAIVGGSGSGKSWLAEKLQARLGRRATRLSLDAFYRDRSNLAPSRRAKLNFDHPRSIDWTSFERALRHLRVGHPVRIPSYDFATHCRVPTKRLLRPKPIILVDGLWLLRRRSLRRLFELRIFLDCTARTRLQRRLSRDFLSRGRSNASVRAQFRITVEPMHRTFVAPQKLSADVVLRGDCDLKEVTKIANQIEARRRFRVTP